MLIKCQTHKGFFLVNLLENSTIKHLKEEIAKRMREDIEHLELLVGFPPRNVFEEDSALLTNCYINSGDVVVVEIIKSKGKKAAVNFISSQPGTSGNKRKRLLAEEMCLICEEEVMVRVEAPSDNSCLFSSIYYITHFGVHDKQESYNLRKIIAETVCEKPKYDSIYLGREIADYCQWIMDPNSLGGAIELSILSDFFQIEIIWIDMMSGSCNRYGQGKYDLGGILLYDGIHYDPLVLECNHLRRTLYCTNEERYLNLASEIARDTRQKLQLTDQLQNNV